MVSLVPTLDCLLTTVPLEECHAELVQLLRATFKTVHIYPGARLPPPEVYAEADVILSYEMPGNLVSFCQTPRLKLWQGTASGTNHLTSTPFFRSIPSEHPMTLANAAGIHVVSIGEHVMMTTLMHFHKMQAVMAASNAGHWASPGLTGPFFREIRGLTFGILAYGHIGREIARLASAFGARIIACTRDGKPRTLPGGLHLEGTGDTTGALPERYYTTEKRSFHEFLGECDAVINMLPASEQTYHFIGKEELCAMKDNALLVNAGRGETVDTLSLISALQSKTTPTGLSGSLRIGGACLDVTDPEPLPDGHVLFSMENVIITPHCSWASDKIYDRIVEVLLINKERMGGGRGVINAVRGKGEWDL